MEALYNYTWLNSRNQELGGPRYSNNVVDNSLSISSLQPSDAGRYALRVRVQVSNGEESSYKNSSYNIFVQG
jgi:hypothetical protein